MTQEPKYDFRDGTVINRASGEVIPEDEPVMVFRARDVHARNVIEAYLVALGADARVPSEHIEAVHLRLEQFQDFARDHPARMKTPDTDTGRGHARPE